MTEKNELAEVKNEIHVLQKAKKGMLLIAGTEGQIMTIKNTPDGYLKAVSLKLELSMQKGHFYCADAGDDTRPPNWQITSEGFRYIAKHVGLEEVRSDTVQIANKVLPNPFFELDAMGKKSKVYAKSTVLGRNRNGEYETATATIMYDAKDSLITDLIKKVTYDKGGEILATDEVKEFREKNKGYAAYEIDEFTSVVVDLKNKPVRQVMINYQNNKEMIDRKLVTMAFRNAAKKHPAIGQSRVDPFVGTDKRMYANIEITKWLEDKDEDKAQVIQEYLDAEMKKDEFTLFADELDEDNPDIDEDDLLEVVDNVPTESEFEEVPQEKVKDFTEKGQLLSWIKNSPLNDVDIDTIIMEVSDKDLVDLNVNQLKTIKNMINKKVEGM